jgi:O-antigen/teichoic acid export membrane protein
MVFTTLTNFLFALYKGFEKLEYETKVSLFINIGLLITTLVLIIVKANLYFIAASFVLTRLLGFVVGIKYSFKILNNITFKIHFRGIKEVRNKVFIYGIHFVLSYLFFQLDTILLALWKGDYEVGIYQAVFKIILIPLVIPDILVNTLTPVLARLNVENIKKWKKLGNLMNKILFILSLLISITLYVFSEQIINLIYGSHKYTGAIPLLRVFAIILFFRLNLETYALMLTTSNRQIKRMYVVILATILNLLLNFIMIPRYGTYGAAIVSLVTNLFVCGAYVFTTLPLFLEWVVNYKIFFTLLLAFLIAYLFMQINYVTIFVCLPILFIIFLLFTMFIFFSKEEKRLILTERFDIWYFKNKISQS